MRQYRRRRKKKFRIPMRPHLENTIDFSALQEKNADIYAWIQIPGTLVDYPVLQHSTDRLYYLNHTIDGTAGLPGSIYSEAIHPKDFSAPMTVLYGHNMRNDTMFGSLHDYEDPDKLQMLRMYIFIYRIKPWYTDLCRGALFRYISAGLL